MTLQKYLANRLFYEIFTVISLLLLIGITNATSKVILNVLSETPASWASALATEFTAVTAIAFILPPLLFVLIKLDLDFTNLKWRVLWLLPLFVVFSFLHISLFTLMRIGLWSIAGAEWPIDDIFLNLIYEVRKDLLAFLGILSVYYSYNFILDRLQGEARFLSEETGANNANRYKEHFLVKMLNREFLVRVEQIHWIQSAGNYVVLNCGERRYPMRQTLKSLSEQLDPIRFQRVHRTAIINLLEIESIAEKTDSTVALKSGDTVPISKTYLPELRAALAGSQ